MADVEELIKYCFGDLKWMPPQWREAHPEAMRAQVQRRIVKVGKLLFFYSKYL